MYNTESNVDDDESWTFAFRNQTLFAIASEAESVLPEVNRILLVDGTVLV